METRSYCCVLLVSVMTIRVDLVFTFTSFLRNLCIVTETLAATIFAVNLLQGLYAIKFPRQAPPPPPESARKHMPFKSPPPSVKRPFKDLTPKVRLHAHLRHHLLTFATQSTVPSKCSPG